MARWFGGENMTAENQKEVTTRGEVEETKKIYTVITKDGSGRKQEVVIQKINGEPYGSVIDVHPAPRKNR
jgi:hypothetical protein